MFKNNNFDLKKIFKDRDGDGITDAIDLQIHLNPSCSNSKVLSSVMDLSACLGFGTMGMDLPFIRTDQQKDPSFKHHLFVGSYDEIKGLTSEKNRYHYFLQGKNETDLAKNIRKFAFAIASRGARREKKWISKMKKGREEFDLLNPFSVNGFYSSSTKIPLPVYVPYKILLFSDLDLETAAEAINFAARIGLETLALELPFTFPPENKPKEVKNLIYIGKKEDLDRTGLKRFENLFDSKWKSGIFLIPSNRKIPDVLICGEGEGLREILNYMSQIPMSSRGAEAPVFNATKKYFNELNQFISGKEGKVGIPKKVVREYFIPDEKKEIFKILKEKLGKKLGEATGKISSLEIQIFVTRPEAVRRIFERQVKKWMRGVGIKRVKVNLLVLNAYKPGLSWLKEVVLKEIQGLEIDRIEIAFKAFRSKGLEESLRWLQEIYPIDEILSSKLSISKNNIVFKKMNRAKEVYRFRAWRKGKVVYEKSFSPKWITQPYLAHFRKAGVVHPTTGWVEMKIDGEEIINRRVETGIERIWEIYQREILPLIEKEAKKVLLERKPFLSRSIFEEIRFDVFFNYPMEPLNIDEERVSPLEALHEELYFVTLDFLSNLLKNKAIKNRTPGHILPVMHSKYRGKEEKFKFTLVHKLTRSQSYRKKREIKMVLNGISFNQTKTGIDYTVEFEKGDNPRRFKRQLRSFHLSRRDGFHLIKVSEIISNRRKLRIHMEGKWIEGEKNFLRKIKKLGDIPIERPIGYQEGVKLIRSFDGLQGIKVIEEGHSFEGRTLYSLENTFPCQSAFISHAKQIIFKSNFFINCRHHANEISSTNAGFLLSYLLAKKPILRRLLRRVNVVLNPMENVDGVVLLEEMLRFMPTDKLHAARYNGAGQEFYSEYFNPKTLFGEARVKPSMWERWLPDICIDNHGFPSHEWAQPFSGYAPYRFRDFWIPRALIYFYLPHLEDRKGSQVRSKTEALGSWLSKNILGDMTIADLNRKYSERYWKYRGQWIKESSILSNGVELLPLQKKFRKTNYSYLYPEMTSIDFISEVADEVTWKRRLKTCIDAHLLTNLAIIHLLNNLKLRVKKILLSDGKNNHFVWYRERPLKIGKTGSGIKRNGR